MSNDEPGFSTLSIHAGARRDSIAGATGAPIDPAAASPFGLKPFGDIHAGVADPTTAALEERVAALEGAPAAVAVASGRAARAIAFHSLMQPGDEFVASTTLLDGSIDAFAYAFKNFGWHVKWADPDDLDAVKAAVGEKTKAIFIESIASLGGGVADIAAIAAIARAAKIPLIVDNTLATPYLIRPIDHGADIVVHSATSYLGGCAKAMGGVIVDGGAFEWRGDARYPMLSAPRPECNGVTLAESFGNCAFAMSCRALGPRDLGPAISPFAAFLILTGIETLSLRMQRHCDNALAVGKHLQGHAKVGWVSYAGLPDSRYRELAQRACPNGAGAVFAFGVRGGCAAAVALVEKLRLFSHDAAVGGARSLAVHPASTASRRLSDAQNAGAGPDAVRLSIGLEDVADLIADLDQALG